MGKNKGGKGGGDKGDTRSRAKVNYRAGNRGDDEQAANAVPQELIDRAALLGCEIWEVDKYEQKKQMQERGSDEEEDSDLSEESKNAVKPRKA